MKVTGLDNRTYTLDLRVKEISRENKSKYHLLARQVISEVFPLIRTVEEVHIPGCGNSVYIDFFLPIMKIAVEVQGEQHYKFISHFHRNKLSFAKARTRDKQKKEWCELNDIVLIEFVFNEPYDIWKEKLANAYRED
jgi:hypothetical protein